MDALWNLCGACLEPTSRPRSLCHIFVLWGSAVASTPFLGQTWGVLAGPYVLTPPPPATAGLLFMYPVGIFFIIFPLNLINPHPVMNLEISIKHTITNQCRAGCWWLLAVCWCFVWLYCLICSALAPPCPGTGELRRAPVQHPFLGNSVMVCWNVLVGLAFLVSQ